MNLSDPTHRPTDGTTPLSRGGRLGIIVVTLFLLLFGGGAMVKGTDAIRRQQLELHRRTARGLGPFAVVNRGKVVLQGSEATRCGVGFVAAGAMFTAWGVGSALLAAGWGGTPAGRGGVVAAGLGWVSLAALVVASLTLFPPWRAWAAGFYAVVLGFTFVVVRGLRGGPPVRWAGALVPALVVSGVVVGWVYPDAAAGVVVGTFAAVGVWGHLAVLVPPVQRRFAALGAFQDAEPAAAP